MTQPEIIEFPKQRLFGMTARMSIADDHTKALWQSFMPRLKDIQGRSGTDLYSIQVYDSLNYFKVFDPAAAFEKWAAVPITDELLVPVGMESFEIKGGTYAVFVYKGIPSDFFRMAQYIYGEWLPKSNYQLDNRPHFEIMEAGYSPVDPEATEKVYIPVKLKPA